MENKELIVNALRYHDKNNESYSKIFDKIKYYSFKISEHDLEHSVITCYDKDKKELFKSRYEYIGMFNSSVGIWIWGWAIPSILKNQIGLIKKVLNYGIDLDNESIQLKSNLITSRFLIKNKIQLDIYIAIASYIAKNKSILKIVIPLKLITEDIIEYNNIIDDDSVVYYLYLLDI